MISFFCRTSSFIFLLLTTINPATAQDICVVKGDTLTTARSTYAAQCDVRRVDCDPFNGEWYCASYRMSGSSAPNLTIQSIAMAPLPVTPAPIEPLPAIPAPIEPATPIQPFPTTPAAQPTPRPAEQPMPVSPEPPATPATANPTNTFDKNPADITDLILITGQSNALGAGTSYDQSLDRPSSNVFAFTNNGWQVADLKQVWDLNWHPRNHPETDPSNNFAIHFGKSAAARDDSRVIGFILASKPGAKISEWDYQGDFYNTLQAKALDAINQLPHKNSIDGILWHQGESDGVDKQYYTDSLYSLIYNLRNEAWVNSRAPFICGETKIRSVNNRLNGLNRDSDPNTACVPAEDLSTLGDDRHFDAPALRTLGARYADAYLRITP